MNTEILGIRRIDVTTAHGAAEAISRITGAINKVSEIRGTLGAQQNRLEHTISHQRNTTENITAAQSQIRDADIAEEMMGMVKMNILTQSAMSMLAQANGSTEGVLSLLR